MPGSWEFRSGPAFSGRSISHQLSGVASLSLALEARGEVRVLPPGGLLCDAGTCSALAGTEFLYRDGGHLNGRGALRVASAFEPAMAEAAPHRAE